MLLIILVKLLFCFSGKKSILVVIRSFVINIDSENTIDERIVKSLVNKINLSAKVLGEEVKEWLNIKSKKG